MVSVDVSYRAKMYDKHKPTQIKGIVVCPRYADLLAYGIKRYAIVKANLFDIVDKINKACEDEQRFEVGEYSIEVTKFVTPKKIKVTDKFMKYSANPMEMTHKIIYRDVIVGEITIFCRRRDILDTLEKVTGRKISMDLKDSIKNQLITKNKFTVDLECRKFSPFIIETYNVGDLFVLERGDDL